MGVFTIYNDFDTDSTIVSNLFIDEYLKDADDIQIKVYLYLLRMMGAGRAASIRDISDLFGRNQGDIMSAIEYWSGKGLLSMQQDTAGRLLSVRLCELRPVNAAATVSVPASVPAKAASEKEKAASEKAISENKVEVYSVSMNADITASATASGVASESDSAEKAAPETITLPSEKEMAQLLYAAEQYIGKPLSRREMDTVYYIAGKLHFSADLIDYLIQYCVGNGKKDFRYIEKVAVNWASGGITTTALAKQETCTAPSRKKRTARNASNSFNQFEQNQYNFEELERQLLNT